MPSASQSNTMPAGKIEKTRREPAHFPPTVDLPRGVLKADGDYGSAFFHQRLVPPPQLAPFVQHFWYVQWDLRAAAPRTAETLPHPNCYLVFEHDLERASTLPTCIGAPKSPGYPQASFHVPCKGTVGCSASNSNPEAYAPF